MDVGQAMALVRADYLDDRLGQGSTEGLVTDEQLIRWFAEAEAEACRRKDLIFDDTTVEDNATTPVPLTEISLVGDTRAYQFSNTITKIETVWYEDEVGNLTQLNQVGAEDLDRHFPTWRMTTGRPSSFFVRGRKIYPLPFPSSTEDSHKLKLEVYRTPISPVDADDSEFELPDEWHEGLCYWPVYRAFMNLDEDLEDPQGQAFFNMKFEEMFGRPLSAAVRRNILEEPRETDTIVTGYHYTGDPHRGYLE